jgi:hypothetical protein
LRLRVNPSERYALPGICGAAAGNIFGNYLAGSLSGSKKSYFPPYCAIFFDRSADGLQKIASSGKKWIIL